VTVLTTCDCDLLRVPLPRPAARLVGGRPVRVSHAEVLAVRLTAAGGASGLGLVPVLAGGRALLAAAETLAPFAEGLDGLAHERLASHLRGQLPDVPFRGAFAQALAAFDLAAWDLKGRAAGLPVWKLLGGAAESALAFAGECAGPGMTAAETLDAVRPLRERGVTGVMLHLAGLEPEADVHRAEGLRDKLGDDTWFAVRAEAGYELRTALSVAHYIEDEVGSDWFERFVTADDLAAHAKLSANIEVPIATVADELSTLRRFLEANACGLVRPDVARLGGLTPALEAATLARLYGRPVVVAAPVHAAVQLACGVPGVHSVEYTEWLAPLVGTPPLVGGRARPPEAPGLGWAVSDEALAKYRVGG
jgi:L-alanine-DL-glutamate epimerase-like enolase superfamily enzyme